VTVFAKVTLEEFLLHRISLCEKEKLLKGRREIIFNTSPVSIFPAVIKRRAAFGFLK
jgi:hypothetical protein